MSTFEIITAVMLSIIGLCVFMVWWQVTMYMLINRYKQERECSEKSTPANNDPFDLSDNGSNRHSDK